jgi:hypothetical protein
VLLGALPMSVSHQARRSRPVGGGDHRRGQLCSSCYRQRSTGTTPNSEQAALCNAFDRSITNTSAARHTALEQIDNSLVDVPSEEIDPLAPRMRDARATPERQTARPTRDARSKDLRHATVDIHSNTRHVRGGV